MPPDTPYRPPDVPTPCQWECWNPGLWSNVVGLPVHLSPPNAPVTPLKPPDAPTALPVGVLGPWTGAQCGWAPSPPATPNVL